MDTSNLVVHKDITSCFIKKCFATGNFYQHLSQTAKFTFTKPGISLFAKFWMRSCVIEFWMRTCVIEFWMRTCVIEF